MSTLIIGDKQILPEKLETVTGFTINRTYIPNNANNRTYIYRIGKMVQIELDFAGGTNLTGGVQSIIVTGLPKAIAMMELQTTTDTGYSRSWIDQNGAVVLFVNPSYTGNVFIGGTYITTN